MRGFMRAIGLGGLLKNKPTKAVRRQSSARLVRPGHVTRPAMGTLVPMEDIPRRMPSRRLSRTRSRESSLVERPQFLFFCGSDNADIPAARRQGYQPAQDFSFSKGEVQARAATKMKIETPQISHRMPVFFVPQQGMLQASE